MCEKLQKSKMRMFEILVNSFENLYINLKHAF